eukprot:TRINITY_DN9918_c0_g1_i1.p1 TRINITY_DN9918_c0_g1~~TRINITY_DN9918_c0_g1_i1.p1  ORF type:complete len:197 (+),score=11.68 TRINITY_DN9918_c0_g1_i1:377-967(+)
MFSRPLRVALSSRRNLSTFTPTLTMGGRPLYFYLDYNVLINAGRENGYGRHASLRSWLKRHRGHFFVTEFVKNEFQGQLPEYVQYVDSDMSIDDRNQVINYITKHLKLSDREKQKFAPDFNIICESTYSRWRNLVVPIGSDCFLLSRNIALWNMCFRTPTHWKITEDAFNRHGLDHSMEIYNLDAIDFETDTVDPL